MVKVAEAIDNSDETTEDGHATVEIKVGSSELAAAEREATCENPKWRVVPDPRPPSKCR